jgi:hypothetical protein
MILAEETANAATVVNEFEEKDFRLALRRPWGLVIGWTTQFIVMPLVVYLLIISVLLPFSTAEGILFVALGALIMGSVPAGTTSNLFTYFSKGNVALSVTMTVNSTLWAFIMTPAALFIYSNLLGLDESFDGSSWSWNGLKKIQCQRRCRNRANWIRCWASVYTILDHHLGSKKLAVASHH